MKLQAGPAQHRLFNAYLYLLSALVVLACVLYWTLHLRWPWMVAACAALPLGLLRLVRTVTFLGGLLFYVGRVVCRGIVRLFTGRSFFPEPPPLPPAPLTKTQLRKLRRQQRTLR